MGQRSEKLVFNSVLNFRRVNFFWMLLPEMQVSYPIYFMKKYKNSDDLAIIDNYNFCDKHTHRQTDMATL